MTSSASAETVPSRTITRPQMRPPPPEESGVNPFVLPANSEVFTFRQQDVQNQKEKKNMQLSMPIYRRQYHQPRITARLPPTPPPDDPQVAQDDNFFRKNLAYTRVAMQNKGVERQTLAEFVQNKKDMFFLQYAINVKREQMAKLETTVTDEQDRLDRDKKKIEKDYQVFDEFLKENDQMAVEAIRLAEDEAKTTMDKVSQIRQINIQIMATKSFIIKLEERYRELRMYRRFLFALAPQEWRQQREEAAQHQIMSRQLTDQLQETTIDTGSRSSQISTMLLGSGLQQQAAGRGHRRTSYAVGKPSSSRVQLITPAGGTGGVRLPQISTSRVQPSSNQLRLSGSRPPQVSSGRLQRRRLMMTGSASSQQPSTPDSVTSTATTHRSSIAPSSVMVLNTAESTADEELYFTDVQQLFAVFVELEEQNLKLIQNSQETEEALEEMKSSGEVTKERIAREVTVLEQQVGLLQEAVRWEEEKSEQLELFCKIFNQGEFQAEEQESALAELNDQVTAVYTAILGENQANISTLQMLASLESRIEDMFEFMETVSPEKLQAAEKMRERERRLKLRELKIRQQAEAQADRMRRTRLRAMAEVVRHTGRPLVFRSRPPTPQRLHSKTARETEQEMEEYNYFFGE